MINAIIGSFHTQWRVWLFFGILALTFLSVSSLSILTNKLGRKNLRYTQSFLGRWLREISSDIFLFGNIGGSAIALGILGEGYIKGGFRIGIFVAEVAALLLVALSAIAAIGVGEERIALWLQRLPNRRDRRNWLTFLPVGASIAKIGIYLAGFACFLGLAGFDLRPLLGVSAMVGFVLGLAGQHILQDMLATLFIFTDRLYYVGSIVRFPGQKPGRILRISARCTFVELADNHSYIIHNRNVDKIVRIKETEDDD